LRGRKSPAEVERIRQAVAVTEQSVGLLTPQIRSGLSERDLAAFAQAQCRWGLAWR
jgi:Xaa-Pro aminopeptidase